MRRWTKGGPRGVVETCGQRGPARVAKSAGVTYVDDPAILDRIGPASDG